MHQRRVPEWLRHNPAPSVRGFATLAGFEAVARGILISVFPLAMYRALQDAALVSEIYFLVGLASLLSGLLVPWLTRFVPRRWVYSVGAAMFVAGALLAIEGSAPAVIAALLMINVSVVTTFVCFNAYVLDYIAKIDLGKAETSRMFYSAAGWTIGPFAGVMLMQWWAPAPFLIASVAAAMMLVAFLIMRLGNGKLITRAKAPPPNPLAFLPRFFAQPRLVAGWLFAVIRSCGWWVYVVYVPIFAIENGLGDQVGGAVLSVSNAALFTTPLMLRWMRARSIRAAVRLGFAMAGALFVSAALLAGLPWISILCVMLGSFFLILLDVSAGLPFLLAVRPGERTEMSAVYSSYRDVSGILTPGAAWLVLMVAPVAGIFAAGGVALGGAWIIAGRLHRRLGTARLRVVALDPDLKAGAPVLAE